jgi:hypothetical protein
MVFRMLKKKESFFIKGLSLVSYAPAPKIILNPGIALWKIIDIR